MKLSAVMWAMLACASLTVEARATSSSHAGRSAAAAASPRRGAVTPQPRIGKTAIGHAGGGNAARRHSLPKAQASVKPAAQPMPVRSSTAASPTARPGATSRGSTIGGPRAQGVGRVDGGAVSRTHSTAIDGTQLRRHF